MLSQDGRDRTKTKTLLVSERLTRSTHLVALVDNGRSLDDWSFDGWIGRLYLPGLGDASGCWHNHGENLRDDRH